jgi:hypothetical protein
MAAVPGKSMISKLQKAQLEQPATITLQLFHSKGTAFSGDDCLTCCVEIDQDRSFRHSFELPQSEPFLRLDIGEYFARINNFMASMRSTVTTENDTKEYDLRNYVLSSHQFHWSGESLLCGYDAHCIIANPLAGKDVQVTICGTIHSGL